MKIKVYFLRMDTRHGDSVELFTDPAKLEAAESALITGSDCQYAKDQLTAGNQVEAWMAFCEHSSEHEDYYQREVHELDLPPALQALLQQAESALAEVHSTLWPKKHPLLENVGAALKALRDAAEQAMQALTPPRNQEEQEAHTALRKALQ
jgi:hypothetical protein